MDKKSNINFPALGATEAILDILASRENTLLSVSSLCRGGHLLGIRDQNIRVGLTRLAAQGKIIKTGRGTYRLSKEGNRLYGDITGWYEKSRDVTVWKKEWIGVIDTTVPKSRKSEWRRHCHALMIKGFKTHDSGLHLRPDNLGGGLAKTEQDLRILGLADRAQVIGISALAGEDLPSLQALWDIDGLTRQYEQLYADLRTSEEKLSALPLEEAAVVSFHLGRYVIRHIIQDPLLPTEMMQDNGREKLIEKTRSYQNRARDLWTRVLND